jgi:hypothetical protein
MERAVVLVLVQELAALDLCLVKAARLNQRADLRSGQRAATRLNAPTAGAARLAT